MIYKLRHFENNFQIVSSLGWTLIVLGLISLFISPWPIAALFVILGVILILLQLRGRRIVVDTDGKSVRSGKETNQLVNPSLVYVNEVKVSQVVSSRASSSNIKTYFYKAYIQDGDERVLISCNRNDQRDMKTIESIAKDLGVPFQKNYT